jgi:lysophospholipase L1-like esterase
VADAESVTTAGRQPADGGWFRRRRGSLLLAGATTIVTVGMLVGIGEWAVRHRERTRSTVPGTMSQMFYRHRRLMHGLVRGMDYYGWVSVGRQGFRGMREVSQTPPDSVTRIIVVGGSTTFDSNVSDSSSWPARLERVLNARSPGRYEVLNAGVPGFQVLDDLVRLQAELQWYDPAIVVLYQGHNDLFNTLGRAIGSGSGTTAFDPRPDEIPTVYPWERWLERHSLLYNKVTQRLLAMRYRSSGIRQRTQVSPQTFENQVAIGAERFGREVRAFLAVAQSHGFQVIVPQIVYAAQSGVAGASDSVMTALWSRAIPSAPASVVWRGYARYDSVSRAAAARFGAMYVPASDAALWLLSGYVADDPIHFNDEGSRRFADHLARAILATADLNRRTQKTAALRQAGRIASRDRR